MNDVFDLFIAILFAKILIFEFLDLPTFGSQNCDFVDFWLQFQNDEEHDQILRNLHSCWVLCTYDKANVQVSSFRVIKSLQKDTKVVIGGLPLVLYKVMYTYQNKLAQHNKTSSM